MDKSGGKDEHMAQVMLKEKARARADLTAAHVVPKLVHFDLSPHTCSSALSGAAKPVSRALHVPRVPCPLLLPSCSCARSPL